jgi:hypothetical protein
MTAPPPAKARTGPLMRARRYLHRLIAGYLLYFTPGDSRILEIAPSSRLLKDAIGAASMRVLRPARPADFEPSETLGDLDEATRFRPDRIILNGCLHFEPDILGALGEIHRVCRAETRLFITYYSSLWKPLFRVATALGAKTKGPEANWIAPSDMENMLRLAGFDVVMSQPRVLLPVWIPGLSYLLNRWLAPLPVVRWFALINVVVARARKDAWSAPPSVSVVVAARNEAGNIEDLIRRLPRMGPQDELIFVEGHSTDDTWAIIQGAAARHPGMDITWLKQPGEGKGDAIRAGFAVAKREILMILDADLTVPPEELPKFYRGRVSDVGEFINGSRLVYPMARGAMGFFNMLGNKFFAQALSFLLGQPLKDTLCGTKVIDRASYEQLARERARFGDFDPFGDFDLIFGAQRLGLKIVELPVRYRERTYGATNIRRWFHGWLLLRMTLFAARRVKFI